MDKTDHDDDSRCDGQPLFDWVCRQADVEKSLDGMDGDALRALVVYLKHLPDGGVPRLIHGLVLDIAARRYLEGGAQ